MIRFLGSHDPKINYFSRYNLQPEGKKRRVSLVSSRLSGRLVRGPRTPVGLCGLLQDAKPKWQHFVVVAPYGVGAIF